VLEKHLREGVAAAAPLPRLYVLLRHANGRAPAERLAHEVLGSAILDRLRDELESVESELRLSGGATTGAGVDAIRVVARCGDVVVLSEPALHGVLAQHGADGAGLGSWKGTG
jgi:hypothetical protein